MTDISDRQDAGEALKLVLKRHAQPDPSTISTLPKGGTKLDFVGHAETTRILIEEDPLWTWEPAAMSPEGGPLIAKRGDTLVLWGRMTVHGKTLPCVGTCEAKKVEADKELIGDLIRNGAMRFGIALNLWSKAEKAEASYEPPAPLPPPWDEARWKRLAARLKALESDAKDGVVAELTGYGLFKDRRPVMPFDGRALDSIEALIGAAETVTPTEDHSPHAIEVMRGATGIDDPLNPPEGKTLEPWMWELAEVTDLDAHDWKATARAMKARQAPLVERAFRVAEKLGDPAPDGISDIHGATAVKLRNELLRDPAPF